MNTLWHWIRFIIIFPFLVVMTICFVIIGFVYREFSITMWKTFAAQLALKTDLFEK